MILNVQVCPGVCSEVTDILLQVLLSPLPAGEVSHKSNNDGDDNNAGAGTT